MNMYLRDIGAEIADISSMRREVIIWNVSYV